MDGVVSSLSTRSSQSQRGILSLIDNNTSKRKQVSSNLYPDRDEIIASRVIAFIADALHANSRNRRCLTGIAIGTDDKRVSKYRRIRERLLLAMRASLYGLRRIFLV